MAPPSVGSCETTVGSENGVHANLAEASTLDHPASRHCELVLAGMRQESTVRHLDLLQENAVQEKAVMSGHSKVENLSRQDR
jgi:hypothetical protein